MTQEDARLLGGALTFKDRSVEDVMTKLDDVYSLSLDSVLDESTYLEILARGHTRVPVYDKKPSDIVAILLAADLSARLVVTRTVRLGFDRVAL